MRCSVCVAIAVAIAACDSPPPTARLYEPNVRWLHDRISLAIDQPIDLDGYRGCDVFAGDDSVEIAAQLGGNVDNIYSVSATIAADVEAAGPFRLEVFAYHDGQRVTPDTFEWDLASWSIDELPADAPPRDAPHVVERVVPADPPWRRERREIVVIWPTETGLAAMARHDTGNWDDVGDPEIFASSIRTAADGDGHVFAAWGTYGFAVNVGDASGYSYWDTSIQRPSVGEDPSLSASPSGTVAVVGVLGGAAVAIASGAPTETGQEWTTASIVATSIVGRPAIALVGYEDTPFVAYVDATSEGSTLRVAAWYEGEWTILGEAAVANPVGDPAMVAHGDNAVVAWNDGGAIATAKVGFSGWSSLPSPGAADRGPELAGSRTGAVTVSLIDGSVAGTLRLDGESWAALGSPWIDSGGTPSAAASALWAGHAPVTAWLDEGRVRVALYNGEVPVRGE